MQITCCQHCKAPKRHPGCHSKCPEYIKQRKQLDTQNDLKSRKYFEDSLVYGVRSALWRDNKR